MCRTQTFEMTLKSKVANGLKWKAINLLGKQLLSLVVFTTLARQLDPSAFGLVGLVSVYLVFVGMFVDQGIGTALVQRADLERKHLDTAFWCNVGSSIVVCLATIAFAVPIASLMEEPKLAPLLRWSSIVLIIGALSTVHSAQFTRAMDFRQVTLRTLIGNAIGGVVGVCLALAGFGVWALIGQQIAGGMAGAIFLWSVSPYRPGLHFSVRHLRELFRVASSVFISSFLWFFSFRLDQIIIGRFAGAPVLGLYLLGSKLPEMAKLVTQEPMREVTLPALSRLQNDHGRMCQAIYRAMELNALVSFAVFVGIAAVASDIVPLIFGAKWAPAAGITALLSIYALVNALQTFFHPALLASGGSGKFVLVNLCQSVGVLLACTIGIRYGIEHLVYGLILNAFIVAIPTLLFLKRRIDLSVLLYCKPCVVPALASLFMVGVIQLTSLAGPSVTNPLTRVILHVAVGAIAYIGFVFLFQKRSLLVLVETIGLILKRSQGALNPPPLV